VISLATGIAATAARGYRCVIVAKGGEAEQE
jgi:hypothetical protein